MNVGRFAASRPGLTEMGLRFIAIACALFGFAVSALGQPAAPEIEREPAELEPAWTFVVIKLRYADAEQVASVLRKLLPPTISVEPYYPTNAVLISGDPALIGEIEPRDPTEEHTND
jgi:hypothetical protein